MHKYNNTPSQKYLLKCFSYDADSGILTRIWGPNYHSDQFLNKPAGWLDAEGYIRVQIKQTGYKAHRIIWKMFYGLEPLELDHINRIRSDNRIDNLRQVTRSENQRNRTINKDNKTGVAGVHFDKKQKRWQAFIKNNEGKQISKYFHDFNDAVFWRKYKEIEYGYTCS